MGREVVLNALGEHQSTLHCKGAFPLGPHFSNTVLQHGVSHRAKEAVLSLLPRDKQAAFCSSFIGATSVLSETNTTRVCERQQLFFDYIWDSVCEPTNRSLSIITGGVPGWLSQLCL